LRHYFFLPSWQPVVLAHFGRYKSKAYDGAGLQPEYWIVRMSLIYQGQGETGQHHWLWCGVYCNVDLARAQVLARLYQDFLLVRFHLFVNF
jgi:hypothetical protein